MPEGDAAFICPTLVMNAISSHAESEDGDLRRLAVLTSRSAWYRGHQPLWTRQLLVSDPMRCLPFAI
jgi:hypothetical protein